ncbi:Crp/Fnr family transcriptional regulator [Palleronia sp. KMU-117]|uniref:Crp/Fnr family transcriptional regulator n=1 Tax=Palleronia sp. KMU-117 TaxID=3434108 RepID=UPI003D72DF0D
MAKTTTSAKDLRMSWVSFERGAPLAICLCKTTSAPNSLRQVKQSGANSVATRRSAQGSEKAARVTPAMRLGNLVASGWLSQQPEDFQLRLADLGRWVTVAGGRRLYSAGDEPDAVYGIDSGLLDIAIPILGGEECVVHRAVAGFWIGDGALLPGAPRTLSVEAVGECRLFRIPFPALRRHLSENPADWEYMHRLSTINGTLATRILSEVLSLPAKARVARLLLRVAAPDGSIESTNEDLGRLAGMSRATFRRSLSRLIASGAVNTRYAGLTIVDRAAVEKEANRTES